jgi:hypothetical protein
MVNLYKALLRCRYKTYSIRHTHLYSAGFVSQTNRPLYMDFGHVYEARYVVRLWLPAF